MDSSVDPVPPEGMGECPLCAGTTVHPFNHKQCFRCVGTGFVSQEVSDQFDVMRAEFRSRTRDYKRRSYTKPR